MSGARYQQFYAGNPRFPGWPAPAFPSPYTLGPAVDPDPNATLLEATSISVRNVRGITVLVSGAAGEQAVSGTLEAYGLIPTNLMPSNAPESATRRWVRLPKLDIQDVLAARDVAACFDLTGLGVVVDRIAHLPAALVFSGGTALQLMYAARYWGI